MRKYNPPPSLANESDSRFDAYVREFGTEQCWELDALSPTVIADLIRAEIEPLINQVKWRKAMASEGCGRQQLQRVAQNWTKVENLLGRN